MYVIAAASACGTTASAPPELPDGGEIPADAATVRVVDDEVPVAGARVVFHSPDGEVSGVVIADDQGVAKLEVEPDSLVTVAYPNEITLAVSRIQLLTFTGIDPGQQLTVEIPSYPAVYAPPDPGPIVGSVRVELPPLANAGFFVVHLGCTGVSTDQLVTVIDIPSSCLGSDDQVDITVEAFSPPDLPSHLATTFASRIPVSPDSIADVAFPDWIETVPSIDIEMTDAPDGATNLVGVAVMLADGHAYQPVFGNVVPISGGSATMPVGFFADFAQQMDLEIRLKAGVANISTLFLVGATVEPAVSVSGAAYLPTVRDIEVAPGAGEIRWTATGDLSEADATFLHLRAERREGIVRRSRRWTVTTAPDTPAPFELPELPAELDDYRPLPGDDYLDAGVVTFDVDWIDGFDQFLDDHGTRFLDDACIPSHSVARLTRTGVFYGPQLTTSSY